MRSPGLTGSAACGLSTLGAALSLAPAALETTNSDFLSVPLLIPVLSPWPRLATVKSCLADSALACVEAESALVETASALTASACALT